ncbi:hypothetical protein FACS1894133_1950 [Clostridia bacterium]|nr:hypothetical protein FACS1894133_1950 [Clostridia bacterium]
MHTQIISIKDSGYDAAISAALAVFGRGGVVAAPTDTVYGLICPYDDASGIRGIYNAKGRDGDKPLIHLVVSMEQVASLVPHMSGFERGVAERYWRRRLPLTVVFENGVSVRMVYGNGAGDAGGAGDASGAGGGFIAALIRRLGKAVVAPSANTQGVPAPITAAAVSADLGGKIPLIIDGGDTRDTLPSTIIKIERGAVTVLRQGGTVLESAFVLGLTGGSGAGKTYACSVFAEYGFAVINCDDIAHEVLDTPGCTAEVAALLGGGVLTCDGGRLDRAKIAEVIFADASVKAKYLGVVFPLITAAIERRLDDLRSIAAVLLDAPTLYESGLSRVCDSVLGIVCDSDVAATRITARDGITEAAARARLMSGKPCGYYADRCDRVIRNNGTAAEFERAIRDYVDAVRDCGDTPKEKAIGKLP